MPSTNDHADALRFTAEAMHRLLSPPIGPTDAEWKRRSFIELLQAAIDAVSRPSDAAARDAVRPDCRKCAEAHPHHAQDCPDFVEPDEDVQTWQCPIDGCDEEQTEAHCPTHGEIHDCEDCGAEWIGDHWSAPDCNETGKRVVLCEDCYCITEVNVSLQQARAGFANFAHYGGERESLPQGVVRTHDFDIGWAMADHLADTVAADLRGNAGDTVTPFAIAEWLRRADVDAVTGERTDG